MRLHVLLGIRWHPIAIFIILLSVEASTDDWNCDNGETIDEDNLCDGRRHCADGSDEIAEHCLRNHTCAAYSFRCSYGACITGTLRCNGRKDCADGSDEVPLLCAAEQERRALRQQLRGSCSDASFVQCKSGECIDEDGLCDGNINCADGSDETLELCSTFYCPVFAFRCAYGGCVLGKAACNGHKECHDGSDEGYALCNRPRPTSPGGPTTTDEKPDEGQGNDGSSCKLPRRSNLIASDRQRQILRPGSAVPENTVVVYACERGFWLEGVLNSYCQGGMWRDPVPHCLKFCPLRLGYSRTAHCMYKGSKVDCDHARPGTKAFVICAKGFEKTADSSLSDLGDEMTCRDDGTWNVPELKCQQQCGEVADEVTIFATGGTTTNITKVPWHVGIYDFLDGASFRYTCGGTIISPTLVISAAHCFWDEANEKLFATRLYQVGGGKYFRDYYATNEPFVPQIRNISRIYVDQYHGKDDRYHNDIALLKLEKHFTYSTTIRPVCLQFRKRGNQQVGTNQLGSFPGWGLRENRLAADVLQTVKMRTLSFSDCERRLEGKKTNYQLPDDKFCLTDEYGRSACRGDSGGGFVIQESINFGKRVAIIHQLVGVVSHAPVKDQDCAQDGVVALTNVQYFAELIKEHRIEEYSTEF